MADGATGLISDGENDTQPPPAKKRTVGCIEISSSDDELQPPVRKKARKRAPKTLPAPLYKASVKSLADAGTIKATASTGDIESRIMERIKKCLDRVNHPNTPEAEAKAALHLSSRLMGQYNVSQAEVLAHESPSAQQQYAGQSVLTIWRLDGDKTKPVKHFAYVSTLCTAIQTYFDCKHYTQGRTHSLDITFYGIAQNTVTAAMSCEMAYNLIAEWARPYKGNGPRNSYCIGVSEELLRLAEAEKATEEKEAKEAEVERIANQEKQEQMERKAELDRLALTSDALNESSAAECGAATDMANCVDGNTPLSANGSCVAPELEPNDLDDDDGFDSDPDTMDPQADEVDEDCFEPDFAVEERDSINPFADLDEEIGVLIKKDPDLESDGGDALDHRASFERQLSTFHAADSDPAMVNRGEGAREPSLSSKDTDLEVRWKSHMQLVEFREKAIEIADKHIKDLGIKTHKGRKRSTAVRDWDAYDKGVEDGKKIDVHRKNIKGGETT